MSGFADYDVPASMSPAKVWRKVQTLLVGAYSVEVIGKDSTVTLRVWHGEHCQSTGFDDYDVPVSMQPAGIWKKVQTLLAGAYSVEVIGKDSTVTLRVWYDEHCHVA